MRLEIALKLERNIYLEERVKVILLREISDLFDGESFLRLGKGMEVELPRWLADDLVQKGFARYSRERTVEETLKEVAKYRFLESKKDEPYPTQLPPDFYKRVKEIIEKYRKPEISDVDVEEIAQKLLKVTRIRAQLKELTDLRLMKIVTKVLGEEEIPVSLIERLTPEERIFAQEFDGDVRTWKHLVLGE
ncbi:MAG: DNA replication complex GINS family protein [Crenarchaeota archaeon]|nr:DNA replication complex GINS family protein [Thermoproteota archaeon]